MCADYKDNITEWVLFKQECSRYIYRSMLEGLSKNGLEKIIPASRYLDDFEGWVYNKEKEKFKERNGNTIYIPDLSMLTRDEIIQYYLEWVEID